MSDQETVTVTILDRPFQVSCSRDERFALESAARFLDGRMRDIRSGGKVVGVDRIAVMAALNITHELLSALNERENREKRLEGLAQRIDAMVAEHTELDL